MKYKKGDKVKIISCEEALSLYKNGDLSNPILHYGTDYTCIYGIPWDEFYSNIANEFGIIERVHLQSFEYYITISADVQFYIPPILIKGMKTKISFKQELFEI